ncbi:MAG: DUF2092 domain-containing protein [Candidatus Competibacteraceae bacterium]
MILAPAFGQEKAPEPAKEATPATRHAPAKVMEQGALDLLKKMSAKLAATRSSWSAPGVRPKRRAVPNQFLTFFTEAVVAVKRPNKLSAEIRGDAPPFDFYFNGEKMTAYEPTHKLYATTDAPKTIDELVPFAAKTAGILLPFEGALQRSLRRADPGYHQRLLRRLLRHSRRPLRACGAGRARHHGGNLDRRQDRLALPDRRHPARCPRGSPLMVEYYDWKLKPKLPDHLFTFAKPQGAEPMDFRALTGTSQ